MPRVVGCDPGTSSLDLLLLVDGAVSDQARLMPELFRSDPEILVSSLNKWAPLDLIAGPSGYGLPLVSSENLSAHNFDLMPLVRPDERGKEQGVIGFRSWVRALVASKLPVVFLPGVIHLPTVPAHRKFNTIDLGTADKLAVAALALRFDGEANENAMNRCTFALVEIGSAFTAVLIVSNGEIVNAASGTHGPMGLKSGGSWDGEVAYIRSPLSKSDLFRGGVDDLGEGGFEAFRESLRMHVAGLRAVTWFDRIYLSGAGLNRPEIAEIASNALHDLGHVTPLPALPGAWVKHAAQGAALLADGLAAGRNADLVASLRLREASGTVLDGLRPSSGAVL